MQRACGDHHLARIWRIEPAVPITTGTATMQTSTLAVGAHTITASYSGDINNVASTSTAITEVVTGATTLQISATSGSLVQTLTVSVTVQ